MAIEHEDHSDAHSVGLGELPYEVRQTRGETYEEEVKPQGPPGVVRHVPGSRVRPQIPVPPLMPTPSDVRGQNVALKDTEIAPFGLPATNFLVQTTFDARPINGNDWRHENVILLTPQADPPVNTGTVPFTVPPGRIAIIRDFEWQTDDPIAIDPISNPATQNNMIELTQPYSVALRVAGSIQRTYERIFRQEGTETVYAIAQENELIEVIVTINPDYGGTLPNAYSPMITIKMHGNLLDTRGREKQYEPANEYQGDVLK